MKYKKIFRVVSFLFTILMLLMSVPVTIFAGDASAVEKIQTSDVYEDLRLMGFDMSQYVKDETADYVSLVDFLEFGFDYNGSTAQYGLYVYIYNPSGKPLDVYSSKNKISLQAVKVDGSSSGFSNYRLVYLDSNEDKSLYKFKVNVPQSFMLKLSKTQRQYEIGDIELKFEGEDHKSFGAGGMWIYYGYQAYCGLDRTSAESTLKYSATELLTIDLEIHPASWKTETSDKGEGYQYELTSVYFSVPNSIIRQYGDFNDATKGLRSVQGEYSQYKVNGLLTKDDFLYSTIKSNLGKKASSNIPFGFYTSGGATHNGVVSSKLCYYGYNLSSYVLDNLIGVTPLNEVSQINGVYMYDALDGFESTEWFLNKFKVLNEDLGTFYGTPVNVNYSYIVSTNDSNLNHELASYIDKISSSNFFSRWFEFGYKFEDETQDLTIPIEPLRIVDTLDVINEYTDTYNARHLFVSEADFKEIKTYVNSIDTALETTYLMRFALTDYFASDTYVYVDDHSDYGFSGENIFFEKDIFLDFDILSLTWQNKHGGMKTIPVSSTSIDIVGSLSKPTGSNDDNNAPAGCNIADLNFVSIILGIVAIVVLYMLFPKFFNILFTPIVWVFSGIGKFFVWLFGLGADYVVKEGHERAAEKRDNRRSIRDEARDDRRSAREEKRDERRDARNNEYDRQRRKEEEARDNRRSAREEARDNRRAARDNEYDRKRRRDDEAATKRKEKRAEKRDDRRAARDYEYDRQLDKERDERYYQHKDKEYEEHRQRSIYDNIQRDKNRK